MVPKIRILVLATAACMLVSACSGGRDAAEPPSPPKTTTAPAGKGAPVTRTVQGFRIQILTTADKAAAEQQAGQAESWWRALPPGQRPPYLGDRTLELDVAWKQPYYRVRLGAFATQAEARHALDVVKRRFPDAFLVPDRVSIVR